ncbi:hypothetical protein SAMN05421781_0810 [Marinococcus luteus]|uniref:Uncharacterized protein n=1 Tax=Marinococcus luteus TaxID=1122204 RepID=A0A1H2RK29_9BACI|nr:hypothetical protein [Marinococcus luteus]SDW19727.1 hypothetical protein SAMN05421781_0810 [Marinococcus luteus]
METGEHLFAITRDLCVRFLVIALTADQRGEELTQGVRPGNLGRMTVIVHIPVITRKEHI